MVSFRNSTEPGHIPSLELLQVGRCDVMHSNQMLLEVVRSGPVLVFVGTWAHVAAIFGPADLVNGLLVASEIVERAKPIPVARAILQVATVWF